MAFNIDDFLAQFPNSKITSAYKRLNLSDFQKAVIVAFLTPVLIGVFDAAYAWIDGSAWVLDWRMLLKSSLAGPAYLIKNLFTQPTIHIPVTDAQQKVDAKVMEETAK